MEQHTEGWENEFNLVVAQSAPFSLLKEYKDGDFEHIKSFIRSLLATRDTEIEKIAIQYMDLVDYENFLKEVSLIKQRNK